MPVLLIYLLKITVCSGILLGYYWLALRNKIYHSYNRFYLLASVIISLIVPFIQFHFTHYSTEAANGAIKMLQVVGSGNEYLDEIIVTAKTSQLSGTQLAGLTYILISLVFISLLIKGLLRIRKLYKENLRRAFSNICIIDTTAKDTPFSFFNFIFWNSRIDMNSETGRQVFKHELVHVREKHSIDKIFINVVLAVLWCIPFFWLIRRELNIIHEFIADKKSLEEGDTATFALMILQTSYPQQNFSITNQFFYSPIKRRLAMITKNKHSKAGYIARLLALPLFLFIVSAFTIKTRLFKSEILPAYTGDAITVVIDAGHGGNDLGAVNKNGNVFEKDIVLAIAKKVQELNNSNKINIVLSRTNDTYASPQEKVSFAKEKNADCFVSIHLDKRSATTNESSGLIVMVARDQYPIAEKSKLLASALINEFSGNYPLPVVPNPVQSEKGVWVLQANECPSVLIEAGFLDNKKDVAFLESEDGQKSIAMNILNAIEKYAANKTQSQSSLQETSSTISFKALKVKRKVDDRIVGTAEGNISINEKWKILIIVDEKKMDAGALKNKVITAKHATIYNEKNKEAISKYGQAAAGGVIIFENATIEQNAAADNQIKINVDEALFIDNKVKIVSKDDSGIPVDGSVKSQVNKNEFGRQAAVIKNEGKKIDTTPTLQIRSSVPDKNGNRITPLYIINGTEKAESEFYKLSPESIESITVLKNESATEKYGEKGKDGVIVVTTKSKPELNEVVVVGYGSDTKAEPIFTTVEKQAGIIGGEEEWGKYLMHHIDGSIPGKEGWKKGTYKIIIQFIVNKKGEISEVKAINYEGSRTAEHCINLVKNGPKWNPALQNGHTVNSYKKQPITFVVE